MAALNKLGTRRIVGATGQSLSIGVGSNFSLAYATAIGGHNRDPSQAPMPYVYPHRAFQIDDEAFEEANPLTFLSSSDTATVPVGYHYEIGPAIAIALSRMEDLAAVEHRKWVAAQSGIGGTVYANLGPGSSAWDEMVVDVTAAYASLNEAEKNQMVAWSFHVTHGESDTAAGTTEATYTANLEEWRTDFAAAMNLITGRSDDPPAFVDMLNFNTGTNQANDEKNREIYRAQRAFGATSDGYVVGPKASIAVNTLDAVHFADTKSYHYMAEQHAKVAWRVIQEAEDWVPLRYETISAQANNIVRVTLSVPRGSAVLDSRKQTKGGAQSDGQYKGFTYIDDGGAYITGMDVQSTHIDLQLSEAPSTNPTLTHGYTSTGLGNATAGFARTYVRDQDNEYTSTALPSEPLYNWLCPFVREPVV